MSHTENVISPGVVAHLGVNTPAPLSILYLGRDCGTSRHRALGLGRLGHKVQLVDAHSFLPTGRVMSYWIHHTGALGLGRFIRSQVLKTIRSSEFDLVWVDAGDIICPELVRDL